MRYTVICDSFEFRLGIGPFVLFGLRRVPSLKAYEVYFCSFGMGSGIAPPATKEDERK